MRSAAWTAAFAAASLSNPAHAYSSRHRPIPTELSHTQLSAAESLVRRQANNGTNTIIPIGWHMEGQSSVLNIGYTSTGSPPTAVLMRGFTTDQAGTALPAVGYTTAGSPPTAALLPGWTTDAAGVAHSATNAGMTGETEPVISVTAPSKTGASASDPVLSSTTSVKPPPSSVTTVASTNLGVDSVTGAVRSSTRTVDPPSSTVVVPPSTTTPSSGSGTTNLSSATAGTSSGTTKPSSATAGASSSTTNPNSATVEAPVGTGSQPPALEVLPPSAVVSGPSLTSTGDGFIVVGGTITSFSQGVTFENGRLTTRESTVTPVPSNAESTHRSLTGETNNGVPIPTPSSSTDFTTLPGGSVSAVATYTLDVSGAWKKLNGGAEQSTFVSTTGTSQDTATRTLQAGASGSGLPSQEPGVIPPTSTVPHLTTIFYTNAAASTVSTSTFSVGPAGNSALVGSNIVVGASVPVGSNEIPPASTTTRVGDGIVPSVGLLGTGDSTKNVPSATTNPITTLDSNPGPSDPPVLNSPELSSTADLRNKGQAPVGTPVQTPTPASIMDGRASANGTGSGQDTSLPGAGAGSVVGTEPVANPSAGAGSSTGPVPNPSLGSNTGAESTGSLIPGAGSSTRPFPNSGAGAESSTGPIINPSSGPESSTVPVPDPNPSVGSSTGPASGSAQPSATLSLGPSSTLSLTGELSSSTLPQTVPATVPVPSPTSPPAESTTDPAISPGSDLAPSLTLSLPGKQLDNSNGITGPATGDSSSVTPTSTPSSNVVTPDASSSPPSSGTAPADNKSRTSTTSTQATDPLSDFPTQLIIPTVSLDSAEQVPTALRSPSASSLSSAGSSTAPTAPITLYSVPTSMPMQIPNPSPASAHGNTIQEDAKDAITVSIWLDKAVFPYAPLTYGNNGTPALIFDFFPLAVNYGLDLDYMPYAERLVAQNTGQGVDQISTVVQLRISKSSEDALWKALVNGNSKMYKQVPDYQKLMVSGIDPYYINKNFVGVSTTDSSYVPGSTSQSQSGSGAEPIYDSYTNADGSGQTNSNGVHSKQVLSGIGAGAGALAWAAVSIVVARQYRKKKRQQRAESTETPQHLRTGSASNAEMAGADYDAQSDRIIDAMLRGERPWSIGGVSTRSAGAESATSVRGGSGRTYQIGEPTNMRTTRWI